MSEEPEDLEIETEDESEEEAEVEAHGIEEEGFLGGPEDINFGCTFNN